MQKCFVCKAHTGTIMLMVLIAVFMGLIGLAMGSFVGAVAWRLHEKRNFLTDRSECEHCHHKLGVLDLIPLISWLTLRGRCRYCHKPIGTISPLIEMTMGVLFTLSYVYWPLGFEQWQALVLFGMWLLYMILLGILVVYDLRWMMLPDRIVFPLIALAFADAALRISLQPEASLTDYAMHVVTGIGAMAGVYWVLYTVSKGKWVGYGDVKLAIFVGVVLGWQKTLLVLMLANVIGLLIVIPLLALGKVNAKSHVPFGPFMIAGFIAAGLFGDMLVDWYLHMFVLVG